MKITGYKLQHALRELAHTRDISAGQFDDSLMAFPGDSKPSPVTVMKAYRDADERIARLQTIQGDYNLRVNVTVLGKTITLSEAVKLVGGAGRAEKMWRSAASGSSRRESWRREDVRNKDEERAQRTIPIERATQLAKEAARYASALREAIQVGNATEIEFDVDPALFE